MVRRVRARARAAREANRKPSLLICVVKLASEMGEKQRWSYGNEAYGDQEPSSCRTRIYGRPIARGGLGVII